MTFCDFFALRKNLQLMHLGKCVLHPFRLDVLQVRYTQDLVRECPACFVFLLVGY